jgi:transcription elongation factor GreA
MQAIPMTLRGAEKLREELDFLKSVRRPEIIAAIAEAREHGDLKENAEYHAAREQQGFCEGRIKDIEAKLSNAQVIDISKMPNNGRVILVVRSVCSIWIPRKSRLTASWVTTKLTLSKI